jgi:hypothetical protein
MCPIFRLESDEHGKGAIQTHLISEETAPINLPKGARYGLFAQTPHLSTTALAPGGSSYLPPFLKS